MDKKQFIKIKKQIDKIIDAAENEALKEGVLISSADFQNLLTELRRKLLAEHDISLEEYELSEIELENQPDTQKEAIIKLGDSTVTLSEKRINEIEDDFNKKMATLKEEVELERKAKLNKNDIFNIVRPLIPEIPKPTKEFDPSDLVQKLNLLNEKIDNTGWQSGEDIKNEIKKIESKIPIVPPEKDLSRFIQGEGLGRIVVSLNQPLSPKEGDIWIQA